MPYVRLILQETYLKLNKKMENKTLQLLLQNPEQQPENYLLKEIMDKELYDCFTTLQNLLSDLDFNVNGVITKTANLGCIS